MFKISNIIIAFFMFAACSKPKSSMIVEPQFIRIERGVEVVFLDSSTGQNAIHVDGLYHPDSVYMDVYLETKLLRKAVAPLSDSAGFVLGYNYVDSSMPLQSISDVASLKFNYEFIVYLNESEQDTIKAQKVIKDSLVNYIFHGDTIGKQNLLTRDSNDYVFDLYINK